MEVHNLTSTNTPSFTLPDFLSRDSHSLAESPDFVDSLSNNSQASLISLAAEKVQKVNRGYRTRRRLADSAVVAEEFCCDSHSQTDSPDYVDSLSNNSQASLISLAAEKVQKVYRGYRTRRRLADSAVVAEELCCDSHSLTESPDYVDSLSNNSPASLISLAAEKVQKVYRGYRTRRRLADSAVVAEEFWWQAIDRARLSRSTISFFNVPETAASRWSRVSFTASKVGKGLSQDANAQKLAFQHWIEAIDPRHRYGHNLHIYYNEWCEASSGQPFFYWLDVGDGKFLDLKECPRSKLREQCIKYLGPKERENYEYIIIDGKILHKLTRELLDTKKTSEVAKWIFVMSTYKKLYAGEKKKGKFHHSSFLSGGATLAAGKLLVEHGTLKSVSAYSGHYRPTVDRLDAFLSFLQENGVDLSDVEIRRSNEDYNSYDDKVDNNSGCSVNTPDATDLTPGCDDYIEAKEESLMEDSSVLKESRNSR